MRAQMTQCHFFLGPAWIAQPSGDEFFFMEVTESRKAVLQLPREAGLSAASGKAEGARGPVADNPSALLDSKDLPTPTPDPLTSWARMTGRGSGGPDLKGALPTQLLTPSQDPS